MKIKVIRNTFTENSTIGEMHINDKFFCYTLEDKDRGLDSTQSLLTIKAKKIFGETAIPYGTYDVIFNLSPKFQKKLPRLVNVKGYEGVLIHAGNNKNHSHGCILLGYKKGVDSISESTKATADLCALFELHKEDKHTIEIIK